MRCASLLVSLFLFVSCASSSRATLPAAERKLIDSPGPLLEIVTWDPAKNEGHPVLRQRARPAGGLARGDLEKLDRLMRATLEKSGGVGLAAQIGRAHV